MKKYLVLLVSLAVLLLVSGSCILDPKKEPPPPDDKGGGEFKSLKEKDDVLYNFALAYNRRDLNEYKKLTDEDEAAYIFVFWAEDFASGKTPKQWGRAQDLTVAGKIFQPGGLTRNISMDFQYPEGDLTWEEVQPPAGYESEKWYQKPVIYDLNVELTNDQIYYAFDSQALFFVRYRFNSVAQDTVWQVVQYFDLGPIQ